MKSSSSLARFLARAFRSQSDRLRRSRGSSSPLQLETLEDRLAPAITMFAGTVLTVNLNNANEAATLSNNGANITLTSNNAITGDGSLFSTAGVTKIVLIDPGNNAGQSITFAGAAAYSLSGGLDSTGVETNTFTQAVTATGTASLGVTAPQNIAVNANLTGGSGGLTLSANQQPIASSGNFVGISVNGATVTTTGSGNVLLQGRGGNSGDGNYGVWVQSAGVVSGGGTVTVEGTGGASMGSVNLGVFVFGPNAQITSSDGAVLVKGTGGGAGTSAFNVGVAVNLGGVITSAGTGSGSTVTVEGMGGTTGTGIENYGVFVHGPNTQITSSGGAVLVKGTGGGAGSSPNNFGVLVNNNGVISSAGAGSGSTVTVEGHGGNTAGTGSSNYGVYVFGTNAQITSSGGAVLVKGTGGGAGISGFNIGVVVYSNGVITSAGTGSGATVTVEGQGGNTTGTGSENYGVYVADPNAQITSSGGAVLVKGTGGGAGTSTSNYGVYVYSGGVITSAGTGTGASVTVEGQGGNTAGTGNGNHGVVVALANSQITSSGGPVLVTGTGGGARSANNGVFVYSGGVITSAGTGSGATVTVEGQGGNTTDGFNIGVVVSDANSQITSSGGAVLVKGTGGTGTIFGNYGVYVLLGGVITSAGTGSGATVTVEGQGGNTSGTGDSNHGVIVGSPNSQITSSGGVVLVKGTGGGTSFGNYGVYVFTGGVITSAGTGSGSTVTVEGQGGNTSGMGSNNFGVYVVGTNAQITSSGGAVSVTGIGTSTSEAVRLENSGKIASGSNAAITVTADSVNILAGSGINSGSGTTTIQPRTTGTPIDLGGPDVLSGTLTLGLTQSELNGITAGILRIGNIAATNAQITITSAITQVGTGWNTLSLLTNSGVNGDISQSGGATLTVTNLKVFSSGTVTLSEPGNTVSQIAGVSLGNLNFVNSTSLVVGDVDPGIGIPGLQSVFGNTLNVTALGVGSVLTVSNPINQAFFGFSGDVLLSADAMAVNAAITAPGKSVTLRPVSAGRAIDLGTETAGSLSLTDAELDLVTAGTLVIGRNDLATGTVTVSSAVAPANATALEVITARNIVVNANLTGGSGGLTLSANQQAMASSGNFVGINVNGATVTTTGSGNVLLRGRGGNSGSANYGVWVQSAGVVSGGGTVTVEGTGGASTGDINHGIYVLGPSAQITSNGGAVLVKGTGGGAGTSAFNAGVFVFSGGVITSAGTGSGSTVTVEGQGGTTGTGIENYGVFVRDPNAQITSSGGAVRVKGTGGGAGASGNNDGVLVFAGGVITSAGTGSGSTVTVEGQGGTTGTSGGNAGVTVSGASSQITSGGGAVLVKGTGGGAGSSSGNIGVFVLSGGVITSAGTGSGPTVTVEGQGGNTAGTGSFNFGVYVGNTNAQITSSGGAVLVKGTGGGAGTSGSNIGVFVDSNGVITSAGTGSGATVSVEGQGGNTAGTGSSNYGVYVVNTNAQITSSGGAVSVTGIGTSNSEAVRLESNGKIASGSNAAITVTADSVNILASSGPINSGSGTTTIRPRTAGTQIDLGGADVLSGSPLTLGLTDAELDFVLASTLVIGDAASGTITVSSTLTQPGKNLTLITGAGVTGAGGIVNGPTIQQRTLTIDQAGNSAYSGAIGGPAGGTANDKNLAFVKMGLGTLTLTGSNTYTGATAINAGTLRVNGTNSGTGAVNVNTTGTLGGTGSIAGAVNVNAGGTINPGASVGNLTVGSLTFNGGTYQADLLNDASDTITTTGAVNLNAGAPGAFVLNSVGGSSTFGNVFTLIKKTSAGAISNPPLTGAVEGSTTMVNGKVATFSYVGGAGSNDFTLSILGADLSITKTDGLTNAIPGTTVSYTIVMSNAGPSTATNATVSDMLPAALIGVTWSSVAAGGGTDNQLNGTGNISDVVTLPPGSSITYTVLGTINPAATGTLSNTATITAPGGTTDPNPGNNNATDTDTLTPRADLSITKTDGQTTAIPGTAIIYTITVSNAGPSIATNATVSDLLPAALTGVTWSSVAAGGATDNQLNGSGNISDVVTLPPGSSITYTVMGAINPSALGTLSNTATVTAPGGTSDPVPGNNSASDTDTLTPRADLAVSVVDAPDPVIAGNNLTYTITLANNGPSDAQNASLSDTLPANTTLVSFTPAAGFVRTDTVLFGGTGTVRAVKATLAAGATATFTLVVKVNPGAANGSSIGNTATASSSATDLVPGNNSGATSTAVITRADLRVTMTSSPNPVNEGSPFSYNIVVTNLGPSNAQSVTLTDVLPSLLTYNSSSTTQGTVNHNAGTISAALGTLSAGGSATVTINVTPKDNATLSNTATAASATTDSNPANNSTSAITTINNVAPQLNPLAGPTTGVVGQPLTFTASWTDPGMADTFVGQWNFGNNLRGQPGTPFVAVTSPTMATYTFMATGTYTLTFTVRDDDGDARVANKIVMIAAAQPQLAADVRPDGSAALLTAAELTPVVGAGLRRLAASGLGADQMELLSAVQFSIANLNGQSRLGQAGLGTPYVVLDDDGAGHGWFVDGTPEEDSEYSAAVAPTQLQALGDEASRRYDLLTVVMHELMHVIDRESLPDALAPNDLMAETLAVGTRRLPARAAVVVDAAFGGAGYDSGASVGLRVAETVAPPSRGGSPEQEPFPTGFFAAIDWLSRKKKRS